MRSFWRIAAALAMAMLAAGCDYWRNLVDDKIPATTDQQPMLKILNSLPPSVQVGCGSDSVFLRIYYTVWDSGGTCDSVTFTSTDKGSSLANIHLKQMCLDTNAIRIPLSNPFQNLAGPGQESALSTANHLKIRVWDNNLRTYDTLITFITRSNILPKIDFRNIDLHPIHFDAIPVLFHIAASDPDSRLERITVNWGDSTDLVLNLDYPAIDSFARDLTHKYPGPGEYSVSAAIMDGCGAVTTANLAGKVLVQADDPPRITSLDTLGYIYSYFDSLYYYTMDLHLSDKDLESGQDSLSIFIDWGDRITETRTKRDESVLELRHVFARPPADSAYPFYIEINDINGGRVTSALRIPPR